MNKLYKKYTVACCALLLGASIAWSQNFESISSSVDERLNASLKELTTVREKIAEEKIPLSTAVNNLERDVIAKRKEIERLLKLRDSRTIDLSSLRKQVDSLADQDDYVGNMLNQFIRDFEGRLDLSELATYEAITTNAKLAPSNVNLTEAEKREQQLIVVSSALERLGNKLGGHTFSGSALSPDGVLVEGKYLTAGPSVFFSDSNSSVFGITENQLNAAQPVVVPLPVEIASGIAGTVNSGTGSLPLDSSLGKALKKTKAKKTLMQYAEDGGVVGYVILGLGALALLLTFYKVFEVMAFKVAKPADVDSMLDDLNKGDQKAALEKANGFGGIAGEMFQAGVENFNEKRGLLEELLFERILKARPKLEQFLPFLAITAAAAPLLGLLGTVVGMIKTFQLITIFGTGDAKSLSSGISEALVTTALGLIVAIPVLILHGMLLRMAKRKLGMLEQGAVSFINGLARQKHSEKKRSKDASESVLV